MAEGKGKGQGWLRRVGVTALVAISGAVAVLIGLLTSGADSRTTGSGTPGSSLATVSEGSKAAYLLLERLGHKVDRQARPLMGFGKARLAFFLAPQGRLDNADDVALKSWIEEGGTLVYGVSAFEPEASAINEALGVPELKVLPRSELTVHLRKGFEPAKTLAVHVTVMVEDREVKDVEAIAKYDTGFTAALQVNRGQGRIYVLDARVFSNAGLKKADNALFLAALAHKHAQGQAIVFDEFVHGFGDMQSAVQLAGWPLRWALYIGGLGLLLYALAIGRRLGPASPLPRPARRASIEQIEILATFFAVKKDRGPALAALAAWSGRPVPPVPADDSAFVDAARTLIPKGPRWP